jgi:hypothetical protein
MLQINFLPRNKATSFKKEKIVMNENEAFNGLLTIRLALAKLDENN